MGDIIRMQPGQGLKDKQDLPLFLKSSEMAELADNLLGDVKSEMDTNKTLAIPIEELAMLGSSISEILPMFKNNKGGLYKIVNQAPGDTLKLAKNGNVWGAMKTANGSSKMAQLKEIGSVSAKLPVNPAVIMVAAALYTINKKLDRIIQLEKEILSFLETEKESEIEADVHTLTDLISKYKNNWDNNHYITSSHKLVLDIQRTARRHMISYQKKAEKALKSSRFIIAKSTVVDMRNGLQKKLEYYRLALYAFALSSLMEILLSGNFSEENIRSIQQEVDTQSSIYTSLFEKCSHYLEKMSQSALETNLLKGIGDVGQNLGKWIADVPLIKESQVDEFLQDGGKGLKKSAEGMETELIEAFEKLESPQTSTFTKQMEELIIIYNQTSDISFDQENIYLTVS